METVRRSIRYFLSVEGLFVVVVIPASVALSVRFGILALIVPIAFLCIMIFARWPLICYFLMVFLIPSAASLLKDSPYFTLSKNLGFLLLALMSIQWVTHKINVSVLKSNLWPGMVLFALISSCSALLSDDPVGSFNGVRQLLTAYIFFAFTLFFVSGQKSNLETLLPLVLISSIFLNSLLAMSGFSINPEMMDSGGEGSGLKRVSGISGDPNFLACFVIYTIPVLSYAFFLSRRTVFRWTALGFFALDLIVVIQSYSRAGGLVLGLVLGILFLENVKRFRPRHWGFILLSCAVCLIMIIEFVPASYWQRQLSLGDRTDTSLSRRFSYVLAGAEAIRAKPILGSGPESFARLYAKTRYAHAFSDDESEYVRAAHNTYLEVVVGTGILGLIAFLFLLGKGFYNFTRAIHKFRSAGNERYVALSRAYRLSFLSFLMFALFLSAFQNKYLWLSLGLSQIVLTRAEEEG